MTQAGGISASARTVDQFMAVPALLEIGREMIAGEAGEDILRETEEALIADAMRVE